MGLALGVCVLLAAACAVVEAPPGGPEDLQVPYLVSTSPDSGALGLGAVQDLRFEFSEKMNRTPAEGWLQLFPDQEIRKTKWQGARTALVQLYAPLPADTVVVIEIAGGMQDAHKVRNRHSRRFPVATGDSIPQGRLAGVLVMADSAVSHGVVELYPTGPDTVAYLRRPLLRRTVTDRTGRFEFSWLPAPGGPWLLRAFADRDGNLRPGEREAQRLLPDTLALTAAVPTLEVGVATIYPPDAPGRLLAGAFDLPRWSDAIRAFALVVADDDTGWTPAPAPERSFALDPAGGGQVEEVRPGPLRLILFADADGDSLFGGVPAAYLMPLPDTLAADSTGWFWEPWWRLENLEVEPGLDTSFLWESPGAPTFTRFTPPDTMAPLDSTAAVADSLQRKEP